ncbi:hypothetical protein QUA81_31505 [Microcoleus sp. F6_B4]
MIESWFVTYPHLKEDGGVRHDICSNEVFYVGVAGVNPVWKRAFHTKQPDRVALG